MGHPSGLYLVRLIVVLAVVGILLAVGFADDPSRIIGAIFILAYAGFLLSFGLALQKRMTLGNDGSRKTSKFTAETWRGRRDPSNTPPPTPIPADPASRPGT